ncbi:MAG: dihydroorotase [Dehalococcoidia bacterium]|nr:dihydroorotase [Dehalococcoidia bacterium]
MTSVRPILIKGGRVIDPSQGIDRIADVVIADGKILGVDGGIELEDSEVIDATEMVVCPGFIDLHTHLREPGFEYKETIATGTAAAARGGFTTVCAMPNTSPVMDSRSIVDFVLTKAVEEGVVRVLPIGAVTKGSKGKELAEMGELAEAGVIGFSDDGHPVSDDNIMRQALSYASSLGLPIINHAEVKSLSGGGMMNEGWVATRLGLKGIPTSAEDIMVARDIELAYLTGGHVHIAHASTARSVDLVRRAKDKGINVTCEVTPHHLTLTDEAVMGYLSTDGPFDTLTEAAYDTATKVAPPLRSRGDMEIMVDALTEGVIDVIATDHAPHGTVDKQTTYEDADNGISNLETALGSVMVLVHADAIPLPVIIEKLTAGPADFLGRTDLGTLRAGSEADVTIIDPNAEWVVEPSEFASKGKNTPLAGATLKGQVVATVFEGRVVYQHSEGFV